MELAHDLWHLAFANLVQHRAPPNFDVQSEVRLTIEPQRADMLLLRRVGVAREDEKAEVLRTLWPWLARVTILEYKSPAASSFRPGDLLRLLGYGVLYTTAHLAELKTRNDVTLALVLPALTPTLRDDIAWLGGSLVPLGGGYSRIEGLLYIAYVAETDEVSQAERDEFLALFSHQRAKQGPATRWLRQWMRDTAMKQPEIADTQDYDEMFQKLVEAMPLEKRLAGVAPEERLADLDRDRQALALPVEVLRLLPEAYFESLSADVQSRLRKRLKNEPD